VATESPGGARFGARWGVGGAGGARETAAAGLHPQRRQARVEVNVHDGLPSTARSSGEDDKLRRRPAESRSLLSSPVRRPKTRAHQRGSPPDDDTEELPSHGGTGEVQRRSSVAMEVDCGGGRRRAAPSPAPRPFRA
jgi:hypothetical protein